MPIEKQLEYDAGEKDSKSKLLDIKIAEKITLFRCQKIYHCITAMDMVGFLLMDINT
jgi:hypothetical protein